MSALSYMVLRMVCELDTAKYSILVKVVIHLLALYLGFLLPLICPFLSVAVVVLVVRVLYVHHTRR